jgi:hypothetical protein
VVELAAAEEEVDAGGECVGVVGGAEGVVDVEQGRVGRGAAGGHGLRGVRRPLPLQRALPPGLGGRRVFAGEVAHDLGGPADRAPLDLHRLAVLPLVPLGKAVLEFVADGFVVRRDDDEQGVAVMPGGAGVGAPQRKGQRHDRGEERQDGDVFQH